MKVEVLWVVVKNTWLWDCLISVSDTGNWSGILIESCTRSQNQVIRGQSGAIGIVRHLYWWIFWITLKESRGRVSTCYETRPVKVQSIYLPCLLGLELRIETVEPCGSEEWQIGLWGVNHFDKSVWSPEVQGPFCCLEPSQFQICECTLESFSSMGEWGFEGRRLGDLLRRP